MNAKDAILYLYDKGLLNIDAIMKNKDSIMQELDNTTEKLTKYDPTRLFKKGDKVRVVAWNGRKLNDGVDMPDIVEVDYDERPGAREVSVFWKGYGIWGKAHIPQCFLELVTPAEELEPYYVVEYEENIQIRINPNGIEVARYNRALHHHAKEAAEAERDRLNAEWRKEHAND